MGALRRTGTAAVVVAVLALAACTGDGDDARYVPAPPGPNAVTPAVRAAAVDADGSVVVTGDGTVVVAAPDGDDGTTTLTSRELTIPDRLRGGSREPWGISVAADRQAWALIGDARVPVRAKDGTEHATGATLEAIRLQEGLERSAPGSEPGTGRVITDVAVQDTETVVVASRTVSGTVEERQNVLLHRISKDGTGTLLAGRAWAGSPARPRPATELEPGETAPATDVDLDDVLTVLPLHKDDLLVATVAGGPLSFFVLEGTTIERLDVPNAYEGRTKPPVLGSRAADGRVALNLWTGPSADEARQTALVLDPATGTTGVLREGLVYDGNRGAELVVGDGDERRWLVVTPPHDGRDDDLADAIRLTTLPLSGRD